jgi:basic amino acid/polyamine antiporter, APA family
VAVMISTFGAANGIILASARVYFHMARVNVFPSFLGRVHPTFHTPGASLVVQGIWSVLLLFTGTFDTLTDMLIFISWIFYAAGAYGVFILRKKMPDAPRPYKVPGYPVVPWVFVIFSIVFLGLTVYNEVNNFKTGKAPMINSVFGTILVMVGAPIYFFYRRRHGKVTESVAQ